MITIKELKYKYVVAIHLWDSKYRDNLIDWLDENDDIDRYVYCRSTIPRYRTIKYRLYETHYYGFKSKKIAKEFENKFGKVPVYFIKIDYSKFWEDDLWDKFEREAGHEDSEWEWTGTKSNREGIALIGNTSLALWKWMIW